jgi:Spy/CpxP family protein refolding chaperone
MKKALLIAAILVLALCTASAWAQGAPGPGAGGPGGPGGFAGGPRAGRMGGGMMQSPAAALMPPQGIVIGEAATTLALTDDQKTKLQDIFRAYNEKLRPLMTKTNETNQALRTNIMAAQCDTQKIKDLVAAGNKNDAEIVTLNLDTWNQVRGVLTADQLAKLPEALQRRGMGGGFGGPGNRPGGNTPPAGGGAPGGTPPPPPPPPPAPAPPSN